MKWCNARNVIITGKERQPMFRYTEKKNVPFYVKYGFTVMKNGAAIQICNYGTIQ